MPSPKPRPAKLRLLNGRHAGVDSGGRKVEPGPEFRRLPPTMPAELSDDAREHWTLLVEELTRLELVKEIDAGALAAGCEAWARFIRATRLVNSLSDADLYAEGKRHPALITAEAASREYRAWAAEFGLTPSSEGRLAPRKESGGEDNPFGRPAAQ
jgi:P27 family predicted phage terminase small subunit